MELSENQYKFLELQFATLRKEIEDHKSRMLQLFTGQAFSIPLIQFLFNSISSEDNIVFLFIPPLIFVLVLRFVYENECMFRAGLYIRKQIEPFYARPNEDHILYIGWEEWLEEMTEETLIVMLKSRTDLKRNINLFRKLPNRRVHLSLLSGFIVLSTVYYLMSIIIAYNRIIKNLDNIYYYAIIIFFAILFLFMMLIFVGSSLSTSDNKNESKRLLPH
jgi:hypothetical protein